MVPKPSKLRIKFSGPIQVGHFGIDFGLIPPDHHPVESEFRGCLELRGP